METQGQMLADIEDLKKSVEAAHEDNKELKTQVGSFETEFKDMKSRISSLESNIRSLRGYVNELENYCVSLDSALRKHHIIISGISETKGESLSLLAFRVLSVCCITLEISDIDYCYRIGSPPSQHKTGGARHRPILVKLVREDHRRSIYQNKLALNQTQEYRNVYLNEDLPHLIAQRRADIRSVYLNARKKGHVAKMKGSKVMIDNVTYQHRDLEILPTGLRLSDSKIIKVKGGYAFASENAYLSNLSKCHFTFDGMSFDSVERAYQHERARRLNAPDLAQQIYDSRRPIDAKRLSHHVQSNDTWDREKREVMKNILIAKFTQNVSLRDLLISTGTKQLIEATHDPYWGASALLGSKILKNGKWTGKNELGSVMGEVREDLQRELKWVQSHEISSDELSDTDSEPSVQDGNVGDVGATADNPINNSQHIVANSDLTGENSAQSNPPGRSPQGPPAKPTVNDPVVGALALNQSITTRRGKSKNRKQKKGRGSNPDSLSSSTAVGGSTSAHMSHVANQGYSTPALNPVPLQSTHLSTSNQPQWYWPQAPLPYTQPVPGSLPTSGMCWPPPWGGPYTLPPPTLGIAGNIPANNSGPKNANNMGTSIHNLQDPNTSSQRGRKSSSYANVASKKSLQRKHGEKDTSGNGL